MSIARESYSSSFSIDEATDTDLAIDGTFATKVSSSGHPFVAGDVGKSISITAGTGFTVGIYTITAESGGLVTLDRAAGTTSSTGGTFVKGLVTELTGLRLTGIDGKTIDVSHFGSPNGFDEFIYSTVDPGDVEIDMNLYKADLVVLYALFRQATNPAVKIRLSDGTIWAGGAIKKNLKVDAAKGEQLKVNGAFKLTGKPTLS